ncbi:hypothetical protein COR50_20455 [Chitinophaga caeni]|uniref:Uncharacterized protein n=1 Tax=Chitinophaga caeni TaxID=2029983 RepID=A0A291QZI1_9BACT|nr:hypothetical protein [Chitinophaga caeni]ATL49357.1 hypothetical protein COR50_20455 [Chitinophaga caeni]
MKRILFLSTVFLTLVLLISCSKDDKDSPDKGKSMKFTISTAGFLSGDYISININGDTYENTSSIFKKNGSLLSNQKIIMLDEDDIAAGTIILESAVPLSKVYMIIAGFSSSGTYTLKIEPVIGGKAQAALTHTFDGESSVVNYEF